MGGPIYTDVSCKRGSDLHRWGVRSTVDKSASPWDAVDRSTATRDTPDMTDETDKAPASRGLRRIERKLLEANLEISEMGNTDRPEYLHALLCQLGLPRSRTDERTFQRSAGNASMMISAGGVYNGRDFDLVPLPYGAMPRLTLIHLCSEAIRQQSPVIDVGDGIKPFMRALGLKIGGAQWDTFKRQMTYLAAAEMTFGWLDNGKIRQKKFAPVHEFAAWQDPGTHQRSLWPDEIIMSTAFYETLREHAVPLDPRAVHALQGSALALDVYAWLAGRLCRVRKAGGVKLSWANLKDQFGHEYRCAKDFKKKFVPALRNALIVYPAAQVSEEMGGIRLYPSPSPIPKTSVIMLRGKDDGKPSD